MISSGQIISKDGVQLPATDHTRIFFIFVTIGTRLVTSSCKLYDLISNVIIVDMVVRPLINIIYVCSSMDASNEGFRSSRFICLPLERQL